VEASARFSSQSMGGHPSTGKKGVHPSTVTIDVEEYNQLRKGLNNVEQQQHVKDAPAQQHVKDVPAAVATPTGHSGKVGHGCVVISYSTKQGAFKDRVADFLTSKNYEAWSGGEVQGGANWQTQWLGKVKDANTVAIVFILSSAFCRSPACMMEFQWVMQNCQDRLGILPVMYETFMLPETVSFMLTTVNFIIAMPEVATKCKCQKKCACTGAALVREPEVLEEWLVGNKPGSFYGGLRTALPHDDEDPCEASTLTDTPRDDCPIGKDSSPRELHDQLLEEIEKHMGNSQEKCSGFVAVMGSTDFFNPKSEMICQRIGQALAESKEELALITGGFCGVEATTSRAFSAARKANKRPEATYSVLPKSDPDITRFRDKAPTMVTADGKTVFDKRDFGTTLFYGNSNKERLEIMGCLGTLILIEGGPGATISATMVEKAGHVVIPVRITGGAAGNRKIGTKSPMKELLAAGCAATFSDEVRNALEDAQSAWELLDKGEVDDPSSLAAAVVSIVGTLYQHANLFNESCQLPSQVGSEKNRPAGLQELRSKDELLAYMQQFNAVVLFGGHGAAGQFGDLVECDRIVDVVARNLDSLFGANWLVLYGGEPYQDGVDTIANPVRRLHKVHGKTVLACQCDFFGKDILGPSSVERYEQLEDGALYQYKTRQHLNRRTQKKEIQFGGYDRKGNLVGASEVWFSDELRNAGFPTCHVLIGGGPICVDEADFSTKNGIPVFYARARKKIVDDAMMVICPAEAYGQMEYWANEAGIPRDMWHPRTPEITTGK